MNPFRTLTKFLILAVMALATTPAFAGVFLSVNVAPPPLAVYSQPACPGYGYIWTPGYWAYGPDGYYWVAGCWAYPPSVGLLWTPCWWGWGGSAFVFHDGYWGRNVGFYGGINYGYGYNGRGYGGGRWEGNNFYYNRAANNLAGLRTNRAFTDHNFSMAAGRSVSFNGGAGGVQARATAEQQRFANENHVGATSAQLTRAQSAAADPRQRATFNGGHPATLADNRSAAVQNAAQPHTATREANLDRAATGESRTASSATRQAELDRAATGESRTAAATARQEHFNADRAATGESRSASAATHEVRSPAVQHTATAHIAQPSVSERSHIEAPVHHATPATHMSAQPHMQSHASMGAAHFSGGGHPAGGGGGHAAGGGGGHDGGGGGHR